MDGKITKRRETSRVGGFLLKQFNKILLRVGSIAQWYSNCLACMKP